MHGIFRSLPVLEIQRVCINKMNCISLYVEIANLIHVDDQSGFSRVFILNENFHATHAVLLSVGELDPTSKNNLRGITKGKRGMNSVTPHLLLDGFS